MTEPASPTVESLRRLPIVPHRELGVRRTLAAPLDALESARARYGNAFALRVGPRRLAVFCSPAATREILLDRRGQLSARESFGPFSWMVGRGLVRLDGLAHRAARRLLLPAFHARRVEHHVAMMARYADEAVERWLRLGVIDAAREARALTLRVVARTLLDVELGGDGSPLGRELASLFEALMIDPARPRTLFGSLRMLPLPGIANTRARLDQRLYRLIAERRASGAPRDDVLSMLVEARAETGRPLSDREIRDQLITFLVAGHDTTAMALSWTMYELARRPELLAGLRDERPDEPGAPFPTLDAVISESLRLHPPIPLGIRRAIKPLGIDGWRVEQGSMVLYAPYLTHRDPALWPEPLAFDPVRFMGETPPRYHYVPFGGGPHQCIGLTFARVELRELLRVVLGRLEWSLVDPTPIAPRLRPTLAPSRPILLALGAVSSTNPRSPGGGLPS